MCVIEYLHIRYYVIINLLIPFSYFLTFSLSYSYSYSQSNAGFACSNLCIPPPQRSEDMGVKDLLTGVI